MSTEYVTRQPHTVRQAYGLMEASGKFNLPDHCFRTGDALYFNPSDWEPDMVLELYPVQGANGAVHLAILLNATSTPDTLPLLTEVLGEMVDENNADFDRIYPQVD